MTWLFPVRPRFLLGQTPSGARPGGSRAQSREGWLGRTGAGPSPGRRWRWRPCAGPGRASAWGLLAGGPLWEEIRTGSSSPGARCLCLWRDGQRVPACAPPPPTLMPPCCTPMSCTPTPQCRLGSPTPAVLCPSMIRD